MNFYKTSKNFILANFLLPHCPTACLMHPVKHNGKLATATALLLWWNAQNFIAKKTFTIFNACVYALFSYSFSFDLSLWWPLLLSTVSIKDHMQFPALRSSFPHHVSIMY